MGSFTRVSSWILYSPLLFSSSSAASAIRLFKANRREGHHQFTEAAAFREEPREQPPPLGPMVRLFFFSFLVWQQAHLVAAGGEWRLLLDNIGITAMHMQLLHNDRVVIFDRTDFGKSNLSLPDGKCRNDPNDIALPVDCTAHSVEYDVAANSIRALIVQTDVWCSSGAVMADGNLIQTGGFNDGERAVRIFQPCPSCDWKEIPFALGARRWYATNHILPDNRQIIIGGRSSFNYEYYPKSQTASNVYSLPFLVQTNDPKIENNLYPFVYLHTDGNLFIFANNRAILFDYSNNKVVKTFPTIPGGEPRCYPSTGSAVMLPMNLQAPSIEVEVLVCGGAPNGSFTQVLQGNFVGALNTCARIKITDPSPQWVMETMPLARVMGDMLVLPNGDVLIINGASAGTAGWEYGRDPVMNPVLYKPDKPIGSRFEVMNASSIPRMYHSSAVLLRDGRVLVAGSNPHTYYNFTGVLYPTELRLEAFLPEYLDSEFSNLRPNIKAPIYGSKIGYGQEIAIRFSMAGTLDPKLVSVTMLAPPFNTHSFSMNQRLLVLGVGNVQNVKKSTFVVSATTPASAVLAPPGYYIIFVVHQGIPSEGIWVQIQ